MKVSDAMRRINVHVNPYLEFMNSILLTSKYNEMTKPFIGYGLMVEDENKYTLAIKIVDVLGEEYFETFDISIK